MDRFSNKNILIVDDNNTLRDTVERMVAPHFNKVFHAENGVEALEIASIEKIDILLSDVEMPKMNGFELLGKIRWNQPDLIIIIMSGNTDAIKRSEELKYQGYCFVQKPFERNDITNVILAACGCSEVSDDKSEVDIPGTKNYTETSESNVIYKKMDSWMHAYTLLIAFRKKYPNRWPKANELFRDYRLGYWVKMQRKEYLTFTANESSKLTDEKVKILNDINFIWVGKDAKWLSTYEELRRYRCENPDRWPQCVGHEKTIGKWCVAQRREYRKRKDGEPSSMSDNRVALLDELNFEWES